MTEKTVFYLSSDPKKGIPLPIKGELTSDSYLIEGNGITKANLVKVEIGTAVNIIGDRAFRFCKKLNTVTIPDSVTSIGDQAFRECISLTKVTIGKSVKTISNFAFWECKALTAVTIPDSVTTIGNHAFRECIALQSVTIPDSVTSIGGQAFQECSALTTLTITNNVENFGYDAFRECSALKSVIIGNSVTRIGESAFQDCTSLKSLTIPNSLTVIGPNAFSESAIETLYMSENNGLKLKEGSQSVGGETVNVVFVSLDAANNYDGPEYYGNPNTWDTSLITDLSFLFFKKDQDNHPDISTWDVSKVTNMQGTFSNSRFNGELKDWNVASVKDFSYCFANNIEFNKELKRWNVQDATTMEYMFDNAYSFNQTIEPPMMQNKDGTDFPTQLTWDETTINGYLTTIYGSAAPQTNPTTFKGVFGMIALLKKTFLDNIPANPADGGKYNTIKVSFSEVMSELITNQQEILKYNYTYHETNDWTKTTPSIYFANTNNKLGDKLNDAKDSLNQLRLNTIVDGMLLINKAYDIAKDLGEDYSSLIEKMKSIYDNVYAGLPFYVAWYAPLLETKENFLNNALTFHNGELKNGEVDGSIDEKLTDFIATKPIVEINKKTYSNLNKNDTNYETLYISASSNDLYDDGFSAIYSSPS